MASEFRLGEKGNAIEGVLYEILVLIMVVVIVAALYAVADPEIQPLIAVIGAAGVLAISLLIAFYFKGSTGNV